MNPDTIANISEIIARMQENMKAFICADNDARTMRQLRRESKKICNSLKDFIQQCPTIDKNEHQGTTIDKIEVESVDSDDTTVLINNDMYGNATADLRDEFGIL